MKKIDDLVAALIHEHEGGERFFDNLDKAVQKSEFMDALFYNLFHEDIETGDIEEEPVLVVSGKFGQYFVNWLKHEAREDLYDIFVVEGGLRETESTDSLEPYESLIQGRNVVFLDDSYYSGTTENAIMEAVENLGGEFLATYVIYDGSRNNSGKVKSLFRYYDHYDS